MFVFVVFPRTMEEYETVQEETFNRSESTDYSKYGINQSKHTTKTALGKIKSCDRLSAIEWTFLIVSSANILTAIGLTIYRLVIVVQDDPQSSDFTFAVLLLINGGFCFFYVFHGVFRERVYELYALMAAIMVLGMYCLLEYFVFNRAGQTFIKLLRFMVFIIMAPINIFLAYRVSKQFGYLAFNIVGASEFMQGLYRQASIFSCLLKFDLQAASSIVILALEDGTDVSTWETWSLIVGLSFSFIWAVFGWFVLRRELKCGAYVFGVLGLMKPAYYLYKIVTEYMNVNDDTVPTNNTVVYSLFAAVTIGFIVWLMLMVELTFVMRNFGLGLRNISGERTRLLESDTPKRRYGGDLY